MNARDQLAGELADADHDRLLDELAEIDGHGVQPDPHAPPTDGSPFATGTQGYAWMADWCNKCTRDGDIDAGLGCPLLLVALTGQTPGEWVPVRTGGYVCVSYSEDPADTPTRHDDLDQLALLPEPEHVVPPRVAVVRHALFRAGQAVMRRRLTRTVELPAFRSAPDSQEN